MNFKRCLFLTALICLMAFSAFAQDVGPCFDGKTYYMPPCMPDGNGGGGIGPGTLNCPGDCACPGSPNPNCGRIVQDGGDCAAVAKPRFDNVMASRIPQLKREAILAGGQSSGDCSCYDTFLGQLACGLGFATPCQSHCDANGCTIGYSKTNKPPKLFTPIKLTPAQVQALPDAGKAVIETAAIVAAVAAEGAFSR